jgi:hypothetical protein
VLPNSENDEKQKIDLEMELIDAKKVRKKSCGKI